jgi:FG-GAP-like repeat
MRHSHAYAIARGGKRRAVLMVSLVCGCASDHPLGTVNAPENIGSDASTRQRVPLGLFAGDPLACRAPAAVLPRVTFRGEAWLPTGAAVTYGAYSLRAAYFDSDNYLDVGIYSSTSNGHVRGASVLTVLDGQSGFRTVRGPTEWLLDQGPSGLFEPIHGVDVDHDGVSDLGSGSAFALVGGDGQFSFPAPVGDVYGARFWGDVDADGEIDMLHGRFRGDLEVSLNQGWPTFGAPVLSTNPFFAEFTASSVEFQCVTEVTGDGLPDVMVFRLDGAPDEDHTTTLLVLHGDGTGHFSEPEAAPYVETEWLEDAARGDFNCDGRTDWVYATEQSAHSLRVLLRGDAQWIPRVHTLVDPSNSEIATARRISVGDFNGDHVHDLVLTSHYFNSAEGEGHGDIQVLLGLGNGDFAEPVFLTTTSTWTYVGVADLNADGLDDVYAGSNWAGLGHTEPDFAYWLSQLE